MRFFMIMRQKRRIEAGILALILGLNLGACGISSGTDGTKAEKKEEKEPITFTFYNADGAEDPWSDPVAKQITEETGVTLDTDYPVDGKDEKISLMIATAEYPDLIFAKGDGELLIENKALIDLSDLIEEYGPHIKELYGDEYEKLRASDGAIYQLCSSRVEDEILTTSGTAQLQWAVLKENHYEIPTTLEEYGSMIQQYLAKSPMTEDGQKRIGLSLCASDWYWYTTLSNPSGYIASGSPDNGQWIVNEDYSVNYKHAAEGQKEFYLWMNTMYNTGILDSDFATQTHEEYLTKISEGRVIGLMDTDWAFNSAENLLKEAGDYADTYAGLPVTLDDSVNCAALMNQGLAVGWGIGISKSCEDPIRAIQFIDWMCTEEAQILLNWGIEDVNYYYDEDGTRLRTKEEIDASLDLDYGEKTGVGLHNYPFPSYGSKILDSTGNTYTINSKDTIKAQYDVEELAALKAWNADMLTDIFPQSDTFEEPKYSPLWAQTFPSELSELETALDEVAWPGLIDCIVCVPEEFDKNWQEIGRASCRERV